MKLWSLSQLVSQLFAFKLLFNIFEIELTTYLSALIDKKIKKHSLPKFFMKGYKCSPREDMGALLYVNSKFLLVANSKVGSLYLGDVGTPSSLGLVFLGNRMGPLVLPYVITT